MSEFVRVCMHGHITTRVGQDATIHASSLYPSALPPIHACLISARPHNLFEDLPCTYACVHASIAAARHRRTLVSICAHGKYFARARTYVGAYLFLHTYACMHADICESWLAHECSTYVWSINYRESAHTHTPAYIYLYAMKRKQKTRM